jgi:hypothetical protein
MMRAAAGLLLLACACSSKPAPFADRVEALLHPGPGRTLAPVRDAGDVLTIDPESGSAAGLRFGQTMDDVIAVWGKPHGLDVEKKRDSRARTWYRRVDLNYGYGLSFRFRDGALDGIHVQSLDAAHLLNGPALKSTPAEVLKALGEPPRKRYHDRVWLYDVGEVELRLQFSDKTSLLMSIGIEQRGSLEEL